MGKAATTFAQSCLKWRNAVRAGLGSKRVQRRRGRFGNCVLMAKGIIDEKLVMRLKVNLEKLIRGYVETGQWVF